MGRGRNPDRLRQIVRRVTVDRRAGRELARFNPDHLPVGRNRGLVGRLRAEHLRAPGRQPRFRLRNVRARHLADIEAVARLPQLFLQHLDVAPLQIEDRAVAQQIHVSRHRVEQHGLLGHPQGLARGLHLALGLPGFVGGLEAVVQRLRRGDAVAVRRHVAGQMLIGRVGGRGPVGRVPILLPDRAVGGDLRAIAGQRLRHPFIGRAHRGTLRIQRWVVLIRLYQRTFQAVGTGDRRRQRCRKASDHPDRGPPDFYCPHHSQSYPTRLRTITQSVC